MDKSRADLAKYRLENAKQCITSAKALVDLSDYKGAANRSYYAIFHSMRSVLSLKSVDFSKHSGVISYFRKEYIKSRCIRGNSMLYCCLVFVSREVLE